MSRLLALLIAALLAVGAAAPVAASAASKSKSSKKKSSSEDCDMEDFTAGEDDCDDYELVDGELRRKSTCGGVGFVPFALGGGVAGRLVVKRRR